MRDRIALLILGANMLGSAPSALALEFPGPPPGPARIHVQDQRLSLGNQVIACAWTLRDGQLRPLEITDRLADKTVDLTGGEVFRLRLADGRAIPASILRVLSEPSSQSLPPEAEAPILARRSSGRQILTRLATADGNLEVEWRAILRDGANAVRQELTLLAQHQALPVQEIRLIDLPLAQGTVAGSVAGSPVVAGNVFCAYEHPDSYSVIERRAANSWAACGLKYEVSLQPGSPAVESSVIGVVPEGQLRRGFLYYVERERAHPCRPFLHYNSWYDICWGDLKIREADCLQVVEAFGRELIRKRRVPLAAFVWDDGWDDPQTLWQASQDNFPNGFSKVLAAARTYHSTLGFWLSPFGGYGKPAQDRLAMGKQQGFELGSQGFSLAGPRYYARFSRTCLEMIENNGANFFKFDGLARGLHETEAMLRLSRAVRLRKPDLFLSLTTGTWPSPFWLWYGDSTWRGGGDMGWHGAGSKREQWVTYRDVETFRNVVRPAPLYPLNSLMNQGFAHARHGSASELGNSPEEIRHELRSFFACGTCLQELYVTPELMSAENWDDLAEAAAWAHKNAAVLVDTHWVGGDPGAGQPYGWASWSPNHGLLALRNPAPQPGAISLDIGKAFELPARAPHRYRLKSPWRSAAHLSAVEVRAGSPHCFALEPFAVQVFDAVPVD